VTVATTDMGRKEVGAAVPLSRGGELGPCLTQCGLGWGLLPYQVASSSIQPFGHTRHGPKNGGFRPLLGKGVAWAEAYLPTKWHLDPSKHLATTDMGRKLGAPHPFGGWEAGSPSKTMWPGPKPTCMPSFILIHSTVWSQYIDLTDRRQTTVW